MVGTPYLVQTQHLQGPVQNENSQPSFKIVENFTLATDHLTECVDSPGDTVNKNLPASVWDTGSIPGPGNKIPHATRQLRLCTTASEPRLCALQQERPPPWEARAHQPENVHCSSAGPGQPES